MSDDERPKIEAEITDEELEQMIRDSISTTVSPNLAPAALDWLGERSMIYSGRSISDDDRPKIAAKITDEEVEKIIRDSINTTFNPDLVPAAKAWLGDRLMVYKMAMAMGICGPDSTGGNAMASFAHELDALIAKHLGTPKWGDDHLPVASALHAAAERIDAEADCYRRHDETKQDFKQRRDPGSRLISLEQLIWRDGMRPR